LRRPGLANYAPDLAGIISLDVEWRDNGTTLKVNVPIKAEKLKLAKTGTPATIRCNRFRRGHNLRKHSGASNERRHSWGKAPASLPNIFRTGAIDDAEMSLDAPTCR